QPPLGVFLAKGVWGVVYSAPRVALPRGGLETMEDAAQQGLHYVELRFSPGYVAMAHQLPGAGVVEAVIDGVREGCRTFGVQAKLIGIFSRTFCEIDCQRVPEAFFAPLYPITSLVLPHVKSCFPGSCILPILLPAVGRTGHHTHPSAQL
ncbi:hypothetical protein KCA24_34595, partial [Escherichia coli]|nr:hypothetical protein [Escherichia coli]